MLFSMDYQNIQQENWYRIQPPEFLPVQENIQYLIYFIGFPLNSKVASTSIPPTGF